MIVGMRQLKGSSPAKLVDGIPQYGAAGMGQASFPVQDGKAVGAAFQQLATAARFYEQELDYKVKKLTTYFEPAMIIVMGFVVGFVAIALVSAMYGIFRQSGNLQ